MKNSFQLKSVSLVFVMLVGAQLIAGSPAIGKSCNAHSANGQAGLICGSAPVVSNSQATGQVTGTKPDQTGAPVINTSNQHPTTKRHTTTKPALPKAPTEGPKAEPVPVTPPNHPVSIPDGPMSPSLPTVSLTPVTPVPNPVVMVAPPLSPQIPVPVSVPVNMKTPQKIATGSPLASKVSAPPALVVTTVPDKIQPLPYITSRPKPHSQPRSKTDLSNASVVSSAAPQLVITPKAETASRNDRMITVEPGRQSANNYPTFSIDSATPNRVCVVSGLDRRKTVEANGSSTYQGTLPTFRMVDSELADLPAWHPLNSGCVISVTHKR